MRAHNIRGVRLRRPVRTTVSEPSETPVSDLLHRDFTAPRPNMKYGGDITYLPFAGGNLYLATVIDGCSRRLVGWSIADHMRTDLVADALLVAHADRGTLAVDVPRARPSMVLGPVTPELFTGVTSAPCRGCRIGERCP